MGGAAGAGTSSGGSLAEDGLPFAVNITRKWIKRISDPKKRVVTLNLNIKYNMCQISVWIYLGD